MPDFDVVVIGGGVVGLAIARSLSLKKKSVLVIEKETKIGTGISSRNSQVIHSGIYYPEGSLKAKLCVNGNPKIYEYCQNKRIPFKKTGKYIIASNKEELPDLEKYWEQGKKNVAPGLQEISEKRLLEETPELIVEKALYSPETGILDVHAYMNALVADFENSSGMIVCNHRVERIQKKKSGYEIHALHKNEVFNVESDVVVNSAGLYSDQVAESGGFPIKKLGYEIQFCKGNYFRLKNKNRNIQKLIYPIPKKNLTGLGTHITIELDGGLRLGPDVEYLSEKIEDYQVDDSKRDIFYQVVQSYLRGISAEDITPDTAGIRPKLQGPKDGFRDFIIKEESENGYPGFINLIGIESPGLTSSLSIGEYVSELVGL